MMIHEDKIRIRFDDDSNEDAIEKDVKSSSSRLH